MLLGDGNDHAIGGPGRSILHGEGGNDVLGGEDPCCGDPLEGGNDELYGGEGNDRLVGGEEDDLLRGGPGRDVADYAASPTGGQLPRSRST